MSIRYPRRIDSGLKPAYGLTARQLIYLGVCGFLGGAVVLAGEAFDIPLMARAVVAVGLVTAGAALAFVRIQGQSLEKWLGFVIRYHTRLRQAVWEREGEAAQFRRKPPLVEEARAPEPAEAEPTAPAMKTRWGSISLAIAGEERPVSPVVVAVDLLVVFSLVGLTLHLWRGGLAQLTTLVMRLLR